MISDNYLTGDNIYLRELQNFFFETLGIMSITHYGAIGDGRFDNYGALQVAIDDSNRRNIQYLYVPYGRFIYTGDLINRENITFIGNPKAKIVNIRTGQTIPIEQFGINSTIPFNYEDSLNKPQINGITLYENKTSDDLGLQAKLTAGNNVQITNNVISATDTKYTAGTNITIDANNVISSTAEGGTANYNDLENKPQINSIPLRGNKTTSDLGINIPTNNNQLINGAGYQTASEVSAAINEAVSGIVGIKFEVVQTLPTTGDTGTIYLISNSGSAPNIYDEYIYVNNSWEKIGTTEVDLTNYYTKAQADTLLSQKQAKITSTSKLSSDLVNDANSTNKFVTTTEKTTWNDKQNQLTAGSNITITNNVISATDTTNYTALSNKPQINGVTLTGNKTSANLNLVGTSNIATSITSSSTNSEVAGAKAVYDNSLDIYSTTEQRVGTWIDGRPLYRRVIAGKNTTVGDASYRVTVTGIEAEEVRWFDGYGYSSVPAYIPFGYLGVSYVSGTVKLDNFFFGNFRKYQGINEIFYRTTYALTNVTFIVLYTKSTDTATTNSLNTTRLMNSGELVGMGDRAELTDINAGEKENTLESENGSGDAI